MVTLENTGLFWRQHKTQNTTHTDTTTNKMSRATLPIIFIFCVVAGKLVLYEYLTVTIVSQKYQLFL